MTATPKGQVEVSCGRALGDSVGVRAGAFVFPGGTGSQEEEGRDFKTRILLSFTLQAAQAHFCSHLGNLGL